MIFNRRAHVRKDIKGAIVQCESRELSCPGKVLNISGSGIGLDMEGLPHVHEEFTLQLIYKNKKRLDKKAVVVWFIKKDAPQIGAIVGLRFIE